MDFFDIPSEQTPSVDSTKKSNDFFDIPSSSNTWVKPPVPSTQEQLKTAPYLLAREGGAGLYSLPSNTAETYRFLTGKLQGLGEQLAAMEGREITEDEKAFTDTIVNALPDLMQWLNKKLPKVFPTYQQARETFTKGIEETEGVELPEKGRGAIERGAEGVGKALPVLAFPGSAAVKGAALATSGLSESMDLSEKNKVIANLSIPAITSLIQSIVTRRYIPAPGEAQSLYQKGKQLGLSDKELAPILATEGQVARHGQKAASIRGTRQAFERTNEALGSAIHDVQNRPIASTPLTPQAQTNFVNKLQGIATDLRGRTHALNPREKSLLEFLDTTITDVVNNGTTPKQVMGTWRSVNGIQAGKTQLKRMKGPMTEAIESVSPQLAEDFTASNKLYGRYMDNLREINPSQYDAFINAGEIQQLLGAVFSFEAKAAGKGALRTVTLDALRRVSSKILTDPTAQSMVRNFGKAVRDGRGASARAVAIQLKDYVQKNLPEEYKEIDWEDLGLKD